MYILQESGLLRWNDGLMGVSRHFEGIMFLQNFRKHPATPMSHSTTPESPIQQLWKPQIKHIYILAKIKIKNNYTGEK